jgi:nitrite reductase (NADH) large subunit
MRLRRYFAAVFPGFVYAFYVVPAPPDIGIAEMYLAFAGWMAVSLAAFATLEAITTLSLGFLTSLFAVLALNLYYFFNAPEFAHNLTLLAGLETVPDWTQWTVLGFQGLLGALSVIWLWRVARRDSTYRRLRERRLAMAASGTVAIQFAGTEQPADVKPGSTLLEAAESLGLAVGASCRQGDCGADLVCVLNGAENLEPPAEKERTTLARLGAEADQRLACCARILGPVTVAFTGNAQPVDRVDDALRARVDASVEQVVVIGNGITGSTALERIAALSPDCRLTLIGDEPRGFYNRMGIAQLIEAGDAADTLGYPHPPALADRPVDRRINTLVRAIDPRRGRSCSGPASGLATTGCCSPPAPPPRVRRCRERSWRAASTCAPPPTPSRSGAGCSACPSAAPSSSVLACSVWKPPRRWPDSACRWMFWKPDRI